MSDGERPADPDPLAGRDDVVAAFQLEGRPVSGRVVSFGSVVDKVLSAHDYPDPVAALLADALMIAALVGASLKFDGKLILQASGPGAVRLLVAHYTSEGGVRGYAKIDEEAYKTLALDNRRLGAGALLSGAHLAMTIDRGPEFNSYQSLVPVEGDTLAAAAEAYFEQSEQVPTRIRLAVARVQAAGEDVKWRARGAIMQQIASDDARGDTGEAWENARALFETVALDELVDPRVSIGELLYRLFHEDGVRLAHGTDITPHCTCERARILSTIASFPATEIEGMADNAGEVRVTCEFCAKDFVFANDEVEGVRAAAVDAGADASSGAPKSGG